MRIRHWARQLRYAAQIARDRFVSPEPEFRTLDEFLRPGDWAIDVGANVGHYTKRMSDIVGPTGRVVALEPVPETFSLLSSNVASFRHANVTCLNVAASDESASVAMEIPTTPSGTMNFYQARIQCGSGGTGLHVLAVRIDALGLPRRIALAKIDAEGHEGRVLLGMRELLVRDRPVIIVEGSAREARELLREIGYRSRRLDGSPNLLMTA